MLSTVNGNALVPFQTAKKTVPNESMNGLLPPPINYPSVLATPLVNSSQELANHVLQLSLHEAIKTPSKTKSLPLSAFNQARNHNHNHHHHHNNQTNLPAGMKSKDQMCLLGLVGGPHPHQQQMPNMGASAPPPFCKFASVPNYPFHGVHTPSMPPASQFLAQEHSLWNNKTSGSPLGGITHHTNGVGLLAVSDPKGHPWGTSANLHHPEMTSPASTPGSFHMSPMMQQSSSPSCGTPHANSPCMENVLQPGGLRKQNINSSNIAGGGDLARTISPQRPKSFEQKLLTTSRQTLSQGSMTQEFQQAQNGSRPKSESEKEKVWKQKPERYKTELCRAFEDHNWCKYGSRCQFAHGMPELRQVEKHPKYKTQLCNAYHSTGYCKYGTRCHFIHNVDEGRVKNNSNQTSLSNQTTPKVPSKPLQVEQKLATKLASSINNQTQVMSAGGDSNAGPTNGNTPPQIYANQKQQTMPNCASPKHVITPVGTPVKSDLSPRDITKEHFVGSALLSKEAIASIWYNDNQSCYSNNAANNNNIVFNFLPKNLLEL